MTAPTTHDLLLALGPPSTRSAAAAALARAVGVDTFLAYVRDPEVGMLVPAPGFPQTVRGGPAWRRFLADCTTPGRSRALVDVPRGTCLPAVALVGEACLVVLVGGAPAEPDLTAIERALPLLGAALAAEHQVQVVRAGAYEARAAAARAQTLAAALETARAEGARLNAELRDEDQRKDAFLAMLGHELRNPLTPLVTALDLASRAPGNRQLIERSLEVMRRQVVQLTRLVDDLLDVSRVSRGRIELRRKPLAVEDALRDAVEAVRPLVEDRNHTLTLVPPDGDLIVDADRARLVQIFSNLLHNAAKYANPGGRITVSAHRSDETAIIRVQDDGVGIEADVLPTIFDMFAQAPVSLDRSQGGLGIGLTLVRTLVELHGGSVHAFSEGAGKGSTFEVRLPLGAPSVEPDPPDAFRAPEPGAALRVLVVDDNRDAADSVVEILGCLGHVAIAAHSGLAGLQRGCEADIDLILLDIGLPGLDGYEVARRVRRIRGADVRLVALTGYGSPADKQRSREAGFDEHFVKPIEEADLLGLLARAGTTARTRR